MSYIVDLLKHGKREYRLTVFRNARIAMSSGCIWSGKRPIIDNRGAIKFGTDVHLRGVPEPVRMTATESGSIELGDRVFINSGAKMHSNARITIGAASRIGDDCMIYDTSFHAVHFDQEPISKEVTIGRNVWLGIGVVVLPGVTIGDHSVLAAGSVVFDDVPANQLWRGNPAQFHKEVRVSDGFERH